MELKALQIKYEWRVLSDNGLLERPRAVGPCYDEKTLNQGGSFSTRKEAIERLEAWVTEIDSPNFEEFVLIEVFSAKR